MSREPVTCDECGRPIVWLPTYRGPERFDAETIPREFDEERLGYVLRAARARGTSTVVGTVAVPVRDVPERLLEGVDRVALPHLCRQYRARHPRPGEADWQAALYRDDQR